MENLTYLVITISWYLISMTVLAPFMLLLKLSKSLRDRWFSIFFINIVGPLFGSKMELSRKKAFEMLTESLQSRDKSVPLEILEIGIGSGSNLKFFPDNVNLTALDMNANFEAYFSKNKKKFPEVRYKRSIIAMAENMPEVEDCSMDIVVCTYVLCSVEDISNVLKEVLRVLKPGGKFVFVEHVAFPSSDWKKAAIQKFANPIWKIYFDGCCLDRRTGDIIRNSGFSNVIIDLVIPSTNILFFRPHIRGIAFK